MDPILLNAVRAAAVDVAADTSGTAVAASVADIAGAAADIAADARAALAGASIDTAVDARAALAGAAADTAVIVAGVRTAALADAAADVAAAVGAAGDLYRRACLVRRHCGQVPRCARRFWLRNQRPGHGCRRFCTSSC